MTDAPARPTTLDVLKDAFLKNAIQTGERDFDLRETVLVHETETGAATNAARTNKTKPAESRA